MDVEQTVFRTYDIRGIYGKTIDEGLFEAVGNVCRTFIKGKLMVGMDHRTSSPPLKDALIRGVRKAGIGVVDIGMVPRGAAMFLSREWGMPYAYVSASHLPPEWNGVKFFRPDGRDLAPSYTERLRDMILGNDFDGGKEGSLEERDVLHEYRGFLMAAVPGADRPLRVLLDCGNGTAGIVVGDVFRKKGYKPEVLFGKPDGKAPNRESELNDKSLEKARQEAGGFDLTIAFDGDADRIAVIDNRGNILKPEVLGYLIMRELLKKEKGPIVANVECSRIIDRIAKEFGRDVHRVPVGYTFMINGVLENRGAFGIENSMHFCIPSIIQADDGIAVALYAAYAASKLDSTVADFVEGVPTFLFKRVNYPCPSDRSKLGVMDRLGKRLLKEYPDANTMDGVRVDLERGWVLVRKSNTEPLIRLTIEADSREEMEKLEEKFGGMVRGEIEGVRPAR